MQDWINSVILMGSLMIFYKNLLDRKKSEKIYIEKQEKMIELLGKIKGK